MLQNKSTHLILILTTVLRSNKPIKQFRRNVPELIAGLPRFDFVSSRIDVILFSSRFRNLHKKVSYWDVVLTIYSPQYLDPVFLCVPLIFSTYKFSLTQPSKRRCMDVALIF